MASSLASPRTALRKSTHPSVEVLESASPREVMRAPTPVHLHWEVEE